MVVQLLGRCMVASLFIVSGVMKLQQFNYNDGGALMDSVAPKLDAAYDHVHHMVPQIPLSVADIRDHYPWLLLASIVLELSGGVLFVINSALGAYLLIAFTVPVTAIMHDFWNEGEQAKQEIELVQFMKNVVIVGALLVYLGMRAQLSRTRQPPPPPPPAASGKPVSGARSG